MHNLHWKWEMKKQSLLPVLCQYLWLIKFSLFSTLQFFYLYDNNQNLSKTSDTWISCERCYQFLQTNYDRASYYAKIINSCTIFYLCTIIQTIHVPSPADCYTKSMDKHVSSIRFIQWIKWKPFQHVCLPNMSGIWIRNKSYTSMWSEKKAIPPSK